MFSYGLLVMDMPVLTDKQRFTYIRSVQAGTGCSLEDLPGVTDDRNGWIRELHAVNMTWW